ncbi:hypothetical protein B0H66DRAFT_619089 [Apodospora peruviana]|uniref:Uncharacterized protein n=1 Tax=Apodospora peruviana TaxID=516989 RepID=A0AAE0M8H7_9PEZI|nr:hypothetical protein B0H66DRAFT_619089 [Apodospora peruviana]
MVFVEALGKPHVHHVQVKRDNDAQGLRWGVKMAAVAKNADTSGYRHSAELSTVSRIAVGAVQRATTDKISLPLGTTANAVDASTDIICFRFDRTMCRERGTYWVHEHQRLAARHLERISERWQSSATGRPVAPWRAPSTAPCTNDGHGKFSLCPDELVGFLDSFPSLEAFYLILRQNAQENDRGKLYKEQALIDSVAERKAIGLEMYHDTKNSYVEISPDNETLASRSYLFGSRFTLQDMNRVKAVFELLNVARAKYITDVDVKGDPADTEARPQRVTPLESREAATFKVLTAVARKPSAL